MIRKPSDADVSRLAEIHICGWRFAYRGILSDEELFSKRQVAKAMVTHRKILADRREEVDVYDDGIVKGFVLHNDLRDVDAPDAYELSAIYVEPAFVEQGVGSALLAHVERAAIARGKTTLILWLLEGNARGEEFYRKRGFNADGGMQMVDSWGKKLFRYVKPLVCPPETSPGSDR